MGKQVIGARELALRAAREQAAKEAEAAKKALAAFHRTNPADRPGGWRAEERAAARRAKKKAPAAILPPMRVEDST